MEPVNHYLFVYGSLRSGFNHSAYEYISAHFELVAKAKAKGLLYDLGEYPAALPDEAGPAYIIGELYRLKDEEEFGWAIAQIDDYEGVNPEPDEKPLYRRALTTIFPDNMPPTTAWIYWYNNEIQDKPLIASGDVLDYHQQKKP